MIKSIRQTKGLSDEDYQLMKESHQPFEIYFDGLFWQMDHLKELNKPAMADWLETEWKLRKHEFEHGLQKHVSEILLFKGKEIPPDPIYLFNSDGRFITEKYFLYKTGIKKPADMDFMQPLIMQKTF